MAGTLAVAFDVLLASLAVLSPTVLQLAGTSHLLLAAAPGLSRVLLLCSGIVQTRADHRRPTKAAETASIPDFD